MTHSTKTYYWDFFGPSAEGTASHFLKHLREFLSRNNISGCTLDLCSTEVNHQAVRCVAQVSAHDPIERSLRPNRAE